MPRSTRSMESFNHAARLLEAAFFLQEDRILMERLQAMQRLAETKEALSSVSGITDDAILSRLVELNVKPETVAALAAVPLVEVAWADGKIESAEREAVLKHANKMGIAPGSVEGELLERWLTHRPESSLLTAWQTCLKGLCESLSSEERVFFREELLHATKATAEAAGGFLGLGQISTSEKRVLESLAGSFCE
jgi:hypothetical protein